MFSPQLRSPASIKDFMLPVMSRDSSHKRSRESLVNLRRISQDEMTRLSYEPQPETVERILIDNNRELKRE